MPTSTRSPDDRPPAHPLRAGVPDLAAPLTADDLASLGASDCWENAPDATGRMAPVYLCGAATSSMEVARVLALQGRLPPWGSVLAARQTSGKGQLGRAWVSPPGNVYAALRLPAVPPFTATAAAPAVGGLVAEGLTQLGAAVRMKWPNDIIAFIPPRPAPPRPAEDQGKAAWRKIGGILLEEREGVVIAGIGINLCSAPPDSALRVQRAFPAGSLADVPRPAARTATKEGSPIPLFGKGTEAPGPFSLWARLANLMFLQYDAWTCGGSWRELAERHLAFRGRTVLLVDGDAPEGDPAPGCGSATGRYQGLLDGLDESGGLRLSRLVPKGGLRSDVFLSGSLQLPQTDDKPLCQGLETP